VSGPTAVRSAGALRLGDPDTFVHGVPHEELAVLREETHVAWQEMDGQPGFWAVLRHADVVSVARRPDVFSASLGGVVLEDLEPDSLEMMRSMLLAMDPPRHQVHRRPLAESFKASVIKGLEPQVREICREILAEAGERGEVEFVHEVTSGLPTRVVGRLMGIPEQDWARLSELAEQQTSGQDPDIVSPDEPPDHSASIEMAMYAIQFATDRRAAAAADPDQPLPEDLTTLVLEGTFDGEPMSEIDFGSFFVQLVTAGNDTTKTMLSSGLHALLTHPDQLAALRRDPSGTADAVEEILRWANPLHYFRRTATEDVELGGVTIAEGDKVAMYYTSANRDPEVFADPQSFDITRSPNPHLSFGIGEHFCLGVHLARLEGRVFFEELLDTFPTIELTGEPVRLRSNLSNAFKRLPVRLG
jgi:cytochrome P450